jgi:hypothetical protein
LDDSLLVYGFSSVPSVSSVVKKILSTEETEFSLTEEQKYAKMKEIQEKYAADISQVLTPEQREKWKAMKKGAWGKV